MIRPRLAAIGLLSLALIAGCAPAASQIPPPSAAPAATSAPQSVAPTLVPSATPPPSFAAGSTVAGVAVGGLTLDAAAVKLRAELPAPSALELRAGAARLTIEPATIGLGADFDALLEQAAASLGSATPAKVPAALMLDEAALRERLAGLAQEVAVAPELRVITTTEALSRSFGYLPGRSLDVDAALAQIREALASNPGRAITLELSADTAPPRPKLEQLREQVEAMSKEWKGVVGFRLTDLASGESIGFQDGTVFAGASTIKVAIMLNAYVNLDKFTRLQETWLKKMIVESDNLAANGLLAAAAGGQGTEYAFVGADEMSTMLQNQLGLEHTYLYVPYESVDYIAQNKPKYRCGPKGAVGEKPYTEMGACLRATPRAIAKIYQLIDQCANGEGVLLDEFAKLSPERCQEMLDRLETNGDKTRMVAGVPAGVRVEHKSGWIEDMQADAGTVRSPGGDYVLAVYIYRPLPAGRYLWADEIMAPIVAAFSRLAYTAYNPILLDENGEPAQPFPAPAATSTPSPVATSPSDETAAPEPTETAPTATSASSATSAATTRPSATSTAETAATAEIEATSQAEPTSAAP